MPNRVPRTADREGHRHDRGGLVNRVIVIARSGVAEDMKPTHVHFRMESL